MVLFYMLASNSIMADGKITPGSRSKLYSLTIYIPNVVRILREDIAQVSLFYSDDSRKLSEWMHIGI